ncbi:MAG: PEP-CTERM sorting domain-containing protein [Akkermansiaceae bacterium]|nr:PEP-CTERM sorting domain-containing protein [Akkermansiaceae bacterium]
MKYKHTLLTAATLAAFASTATAATTLLSDTFDVGATPSLGDDGDDPNDGAWTASHVGTSVTLVGDGMPQNNTLGFSPDTTFRYAITTFSEATLGNGDSLDISFKVRATSGPTVASGAFQFVLNDTNAGGYAFFSSWGDGSTNAIWHGNGGLSANNSFGIDGDDFDVTGTTWHTVNATITRVDATHLTFTYGLDGTNHVNAVTVEDLTPTFTFNRLHIGNRSSEQAFLLDDVLVTYQAVPEPSSAALLGLGGLALILRRRK